MAQVYLAGAIDRAKVHPGQWTDEITRELLSAWEATNTDDPSCLVVFAPSRAYKVTGEIGKEGSRGIVIPNMAALENSDVVLCRYDPGVETWGTPMEVMWAWHRKTPIFVWTTEKLAKDEVPDWSMLPTYLAYHAHGGVCYVSAARAAYVVVQHLREQESLRGVDPHPTEILRSMLGMEREDG
jgi:hypothetical protein